MSIIKGLLNHGAVLHVLTLVLLLFVSQVQLFTWRGAIQNLVLAKNRAKAAEKDTRRWYPSAFWWRERKRMPILEGDFSSGALSAGHVKHKSRKEFEKLRVTGIRQGNHGKQPRPETPSVQQPETNNRISNMAPPKPFSYTRVFGAPGWGFLRPSDGRSFHSVRRPESYVSLHYSTPVLGVQPMNRRGHTNGDIGQDAPEEDQEVLNNVIREVLKDSQNAPKTAAKSDSANRERGKGHSAQTTPTPEHSKTSQKATHTFDNQAHTKENTIANKDSVNPNTESHSDSSRISIGFSPAFESFPSEDDGFGAFVGLGSPDIAGFGPPVVFGPPISVEPIQPAQSVQPDQPAHGFSSGLESGSKHMPKESSQGGFQGVGSFMDGPPRQSGPSQPTGHLGQSGFGWGDSFQPVSQGFSGQEGSLSAGSGSPEGSFVQEDPGSYGELSGTRDCDTILTKSCQNDSECTCYGFYSCQAGRCRELTGSSSNS
ncbi:hypothetical protein BaRGS_00009154, partial [Batillaria attramentaria]